MNCADDDAGYLAAFRQAMVIEARRQAAEQAGDRQRERQCSFELATVWRRWLNRHQRAYWKVLAFRPARIEARISADARGTTRVARVVRSSLRQLRTYLQRAEERWTMVLR